MQGASFTPFHDFCNSAAWKKKNVIHKKTAQYTSASVGCKVLYPAQNSNPGIIAVVQMQVHGAI